MNFLDMYDSLNRANLRSGMSPTRMHVTTASYTAKLIGAPEKIHVATSVPQGADPYFSDIRASKFSSTSLEFKTSVLPSVRLKAFNGGRVHVAGCKNAVEAEKVIVEACRVLGGRLDALKLIMINFAIDLGGTRCFTLREIADLATAVPGIIVELPERPACAILSRPKSFTIMAYATGKAYISARSLEFLAIAYDIFVSLVAHIPPREIKTIKAAKSTWTRIALEMVPACMHTHPPTTMTTYPNCEYCMKFGNVFASTT